MKTQTEIALTNSSRLYQSRGISRLEVTVTWGAGEPGSGFVVKSEEEGEFRGSE